jgi:phosphotransferase system IIB component
LKDSGLVDLDKIKQLKGVIGAQYATDQLQIIIGFKWNPFFFSPEFPEE